MLNGRRRTAIRVCLLSIGAILLVTAFSLDAQARRSARSSARAGAHVARAHARHHRRRHGCSARRARRRHAKRRRRARSGSCPKRVRKHSRRAGEGAPFGTSSLVPASSTLAAKGKSSASAGLLEGTSSPTPFRFFSAGSSFWDTPLPENAPLDPSSREVVSAFDALIDSEEQARVGPWISTTSYSVPVYTVPSDQPTVPVDLVEHNAEPALSTAWSAVPLPASAKPAAGHDGDLVVWQPGTDRLWEFWKLTFGEAGWSAEWGGAMQSVSTNPGVYGPEAWPGAQTWWGVSASSLSLVGGLITLEDLEDGRIEHALAMSIPNVRFGAYASPAQRTDGKSTDPLSLPEGAHLRLNPKLRLSSLHLPRVTLLIAEAAQRYGIFVKDGAGDVQFNGQDPTPLGTDPYIGATGFFEGKTPRELLESFPWNELQLLKMELHPSKY